MASVEFEMVKALCAEMETKPRWYSGRGMYGKQCVGVDIDRLSDLVLAFVVVAGRAGYNDDDKDIEAIADLAKGFLTDTMGRGMIVYWPNVAWEGGNEEPSDTDEDEAARDGE